MKDPQGRNVISQMHFEERDSGKYEMKAEMQGEYKVCLSNTMARWTAKVVTFQIKVGEVNLPEQQPLKKEDIDPFHHSVSQLLSTLDRVIESQNYLRDREIRHSYSLLSLLTFFVFIFSFTKKKLYKALMKGLHGFHSLKQPY